MGLISNGTTIFDLGTTSAGIGSGMKFMKKLTASSSATLSFVHGSGGVNFSSYKEYLFTFNNIHPSNDGDIFQFNVSIDGGSNYNVAKTSTFFRAYHAEANNSAALGYEAGSDLAQGTGGQRLTEALIGYDNDQSASGNLHLFNPSSTTFVKNFVAVTNIYQDNNQSNNAYTAGYLNTTSDIDAIRFAPGRDTGPTILATGDICMYGIA